MEFGIFLNGYIPGPAAHSTEHEHTELMREAEYVIFADKHNWKYAWFGEHHALTEYSHMSAPVDPHGLRRRPDRLHPPVDRHHQPLAPQGAPGPLRRAGGDDGPLHQPPLRVRHRPWRGQPRDGHVQHHGQELDQARVERGRPRDPAACGSSPTTSSTASTSPCPTPTTCSRSPTARATRRSGSPAATRRRSPPPARWASGPSPSTSSRSSPCASGSPPTRRAPPTAPSPSGSSRTTT